MSGRQNEAPHVAPRTWWLSMQIAFKRDTPLADIDQVYARLKAVAEDEPSVEYVVGSTSGS